MQTSSLRRSTRFLPQVASTVPGEWETFWEGPPLLVDSYKEFNGSHEANDEHDTPDNSSHDAKTTIFEKTYYGGFIRKKDHLANAVTKRAKKRSEFTQSFKIGDTVLLPSNNKKISYIGVITSLWEEKIISENSEDEDDIRLLKYAQIHWFIRPKDCPKFGVARSYEDNEIYYTLDQTEQLELHLIISPCRVTRSPSNQKSKSISTNKDGLGSSAENNVETFICSIAAEPRRGLYYGFNWETHRQRAMEACPNQPLNLALWNVPINKPELRQRRTKASRCESGQQETDKTSEGGDEEKPGSADDHLDAYAQDSASEGSSGSVTDEVDDFCSDDTDVLDEVSNNMKRKRGRNLYRTPKKDKKSEYVAKPTPRSKAAIRGRNSKRQRIDVLSLRTQRNEIETSRLLVLPLDPYLRAMHVLHVGARPDTLQCRENEYAEVMGSILNLLEENMGGCVYISGVPGTGKTATVHSVVRDLKFMAQKNETNPFTYVEINGLKISEPSAAYALLWEAISNHDTEHEGHLKISPKEALKNLTRYFTGGAAVGPGGHACIVLMDELDQMVTPKQDIIYNFFNWPNLNKSKLIVIAVANTHDLPERNFSGKVRSRLGYVRINFKPYNSEQLCKIVQARLDTAKEGLSAEVAREAIELDAIRFVSSKISGLNGDARRTLDICRRAVELVRAQPADIVTVAHIQQVVKIMQNSPTAGYVEDCSFHEKIMLASLLKCIKREGIEEIRWGDVAHQHHIYMNILPGPEESKRKPTYVELALVLESLVASRAVLIEEGLAASRKSANERKVILNIEAREVERVLSNVGINWKNAIGVSE